MAAISADRDHARVPAVPHAAAEPLAFPILILNDREVRQRACCGMLASIFALSNASSISEISSNVIHAQAAPSSKTGSVSEGTEDKKT